MKKIISLFLAITMIFILITGCSNKGQVNTNNNDDSTKELVEIRISHFKNLNWAPVFIAYENGFFEKEGLKPELVQPGGPKGFQAMHAGDAEFCILSQEPALIAAQEGVKTTFLGSMLKTRVYGFVANEGLTEIKQLKGKKIFASTPGSGPYTFVCNVLKQAGLDPIKDVTFINMEYSALVAALDKGEIDASFIDIYSKTDLENMNINVLVDTTKKEDSLKYLGTYDFPGTIICAPTKYVDANPEITQKFVTAVVNGTKWIKDHSDAEVAKVLSPLFDGMEEKTIEKQIAILRDTYSEDCFITEEGFNSVVDACINIGIIDKKIQYNEMVNMTFVEEANK